MVALGDSITAGYPYNPAKSWVAHVASSRQIEVVNKGVCGDFTFQMVQRFHRDVSPYGPTHVFILGGANDALADLPVREVAGNVSTLVDLCRSQGALPLLALPIPALIPETEQILQEYRRSLLDYAAKEQLFLIDFYAPFAHALAIGDGDILYCDEVHPSLEGYRQMGKLAVSRLHFLPK